MPTITASPKLLLEWARRKSGGKDVEVVGHVEPVDATIVAWFALFSEEKLAWIPTHPNNNTPSTTGALCEVYYRQSGVNCAKWVLFLPANGATAD